MAKYNGYIYKKGFLWFGWIVSYRKDEGLYYYDNTKLESLYAKTEVQCLVFSLTQKRCLKKLEKFIEKKGLKND